MHLFAGYCIFIVNGNGNSGSVLRNRWDERGVVDEREPGGLGSRCLAAYLTGLREENAMGD